MLVCGAQSRAGAPSGRSLILDYAHRNLLSFKFFQAEQVFETLRQHRKTKDLLSLEDAFASFSDCIIIVLESPGSFAEIGAFAIKDEIAKILLVINDIRYSRDESFINLGPIAKVNKVSIFRPTIYVNPEHILKFAHIIEERLSRILRKRNKNIDLTTFDKFSSCTPKIKVLALADIISMFSPIKRREIYRILRYCYGNIHRTNLDVELGMLVTLGIVQMHQDFFFRASEDIESFFEFTGFDERKFRADVFNYYYKYHRERIEILRNRNL